MKFIQAEWLKYKRTFTRRLILMAPMFFVLVALIQKWFMPPEFIKTWELTLALVYNWWPVVFIPFGTALFAALVAVHEKKAGNHLYLRTRWVSPAWLWVVKVVVMAIHTLLTTSVLILVILLSGFLTTEGAIPWYKLLAGGFTLWFCSLAILPLQLWIAMWKGTLASMGMGLLGSLIGVIAAAGPFWIYVPWSWFTRLMSPLIGVHPNGTFLEPTDPLFDTSVFLPGYSLAFMTFILFTFLTAKWFSKKELSS